MSEEEVRGNQTERLSLIMRAGDIRARLMLLDLCEVEYNRKNWRGSACLFHAEMYLKDRLAYELYPPPDKFAIPVLVNE